MTKRILLSLILWGGGVVFISFAATEIDGIYYNLYGTYTTPYAQVTYATNSYNSYSGDVVIPSSVVYNNVTYPVTQIGAYAFKNCSGLTSISLPSGITSIGNQAFYGCNNENFTSITLPSSVTSIGNNGSGTSYGRTFYNCSHITSISIPEGITIIPMYAFYGCSGILSMSIPSGVNSIGTNAFYGCSSLLSIDIPSDVTSIDNNAFNGCTSLSSITIPSGITTIASYTFNNCPALTNIIIPASVTSIEEKAFYRCANLSSVILLGSTPPSLHNTLVFQRSYTSGDYPTFYVPISDNHAIKSSYQAATNWSSFTNFKEFYEITEHIDNYGTMVVEVDALLLTGAGAITIKNGGIVTSPNILGATPENLIIEDGGQLVCNNAVEATVKKSITGWDSENESGWYAISSPVNGQSFASVDNLQSNEHNIYRYDEEELEWEEYRATSNEFNSFENGRGYLYRNAEDVTIEFNGSINTSSVSPTLSYTETALSGFNLIGNPYTHNITWTNLTTKTNISDAGYYLLGDNGEWASQTTEGTIAPMQGFLVQATDANPAITISKTAAKGENTNRDNIMFRVENSEYSDVTYAMFDKGYGLNKINHRNSEIPMIYIPQDGKDFAIAMMSDDTQAFNLNFEAKTTGKYTLSYKTKGDFSYLHVIDRITGADVDMLLEGEYSFIGSPMDKANRFIVRLEYSENPENPENSTFAYQNGNDIVVTGEGELQIFDVMGRMISTQRVNGVETISLSTNGVYIFRLNGNTQKIVVR